MIREATSSCRGKVRFLTYDQANRTARYSRKSHDRPFVPYHCHLCSGWHIGESLGERKKGRPTTAPDGAED